MVDPTLYTNMYEEEYLKAIQIKNPESHMTCNATFTYEDYKNNLKNQREDSIVTLWHPPIPLQNWSHNGRYWSDPHGYDQYSNMLPICTKKVATFCTCPTREGPRFPPFPPP